MKKPQECSKTRLYLSQLCKGLKEAVGLTVEHPWNIGEASNKYLGRK